MRGNGKGQRLPPKSQISLLHARESQRPPPLKKTKKILLKSSVPSSTAQAPASKSPCSTIRDVSPPPPPLHLFDILLLLMLLMLFSLLLLCPALGGQCLCHCHPAPVRCALIRCVAW